jgi:hypothetical protein
MAQEYRPGEIVPQSGIYTITHDPAHADMPHEVTVIKGRRVDLPALQGHQLELAHAAKHVGESPDNHAAGDYRDQYSDNRLGECLVDAVEQQPRALVRHAHLACRCRDRAGISDALEQLCLPGANPRAGFKNDAHSDPCHVGTVHARSSEIPTFFSSMRPTHKIGRR